MSSLIFYSTDDEIILAMDTLAVAGASGMPLLFTTKFYLVPHLNGVICGTGSGAFTADWFVQVNTGMMVDDIPHLDYHTPLALQAMWESSREKLPKDFTTTIYHFGLPRDGSPACVYAYRSNRNFVSERLPQGIGVKPFADVPKSFELPRDFGPMMVSQREYQAKEPLDQRVHIGGHVFVCHLTRSGINVYQTDTFPDYDAQRGVMLAQIAKTRSTQ
ncbi:MAG: hypothetical protein JSS11_05805 [Verrucomicrobia bacterium]|nr:hypothetical protein [Verrucomicrobiota bacterium]